MTLSASTTDGLPPGGAPRNHQALSGATILLMAVTVGATVANNYYAQPLLATIAREFRITATEAGAIAMFAQVGTACGMFLFVPLGDKFERRRLITLLLLCEAVSLVLAGSAQSAWWLAFACFGAGAAAATAHIVVPFAAHLAPPDERGRVVGTILGGLLFGVLLARTFSGALGAHFGWRAVYYCAAVLMVLIAALVRFCLPSSPPEIALSWPALMRSAWDLAKEHAALRESALLGGLSFAAFSAFWTTLAFFLQAPPYGYGSGVAGLFGLAGAVGAAGAPLFGEWAHRNGPRRTIRYAINITLSAFVLMGLAGTLLAGLIAGVIVMDLGVQLCHVSNQTRIYQIDPRARSRLNMVYMVSYFTGGAAGSYLGAVAWHLFGWRGVCAFGALTQAAALFSEWRFGKARTGVNP